MSHILSKKRGQSIVEWAIILPFLLLILFSIIELAPLMNTFIKVEKAAQYGARIGAVHGNTNQEILEAVKFNLQGLVQSDFTDSGTTYGHATEGREFVETASGIERTIVEIVPGNINERINGGWVMVRITYRYPVFTPVLKTLLANTSTMPDGKHFDITRYAIYRIE